MPLEIVFLEPKNWRPLKPHYLIQKRPFVHNSVCSQFLEGLFAILAECSQFCLRSF